MTPTTLIRSTVPSKMATSDNCGKLLERALDAAEGLLRLTPTWVPRSFLHPGKRIKLHPDDWYAYGAHRGGIDERWFASTTEAANEDRVPDEGLSYVAFEGERVHAARRRGRSGQSADRQGDVRQVQPLAGLFEILRQHGADSRTTCTRASSTPSSSARKASPRATTSRRSTTTSTTTSPTRSWAWSRARRRRRSASAWKIGTRATTASSICRGPIA